MPKTKKIESFNLKKSPTIINEKNGILYGSKESEKRPPSSNEVNKNNLFLFENKKLKIIFYDLGYVIFIDLIRLGSASFISKVNPDSCLMISPLCGTLPAIATTKPPNVSTSSLL